MLGPAGRRQLDELGYLVLPGFIAPPMLAELRERVEALWELEGDEAGAEFRYEPGARRLANLVDKGAIFARLVATPGILDCIEHVIGPDFKLSSLNARSANPHNGESQQQYQKALLRPETVAALTSSQRRVLALDDPENDRLSSATTRMSGFLK